MNNVLEKSIILLIFLVFLSSCKTSAENSQNNGNKPASVKIDLKLASPDFKEGDLIPKKFTGEGEDISPALKWNKAPLGTKSFVIICDDPDAPAGIWDHWILFNIKPDVTELKEGTSYPDGSVNGKNSWGRACYNGPMPPKGQKHRYFFRIYAIDILLNFDETPDKKTILKSMEGHILAFGQYMGIYKR
ncbi:MAG: YbhB/YbcL family Raf kinase inhibitor-like protein [Candidatus Eremiobacterota bacterium]